MYAARSRSILQQAREAARAAGQTAAFAANVERLREAHRRRPLAEHAVERLEGSGIDDSDGWLSQAIPSLEKLHAAACQAAAIAPLELAARLRFLAARSDFDSFWNAPETHREVLGLVGLRALSDPRAGA